ncbi:MAG: hypothetical protein GXO16_05810 [Epsilonproteobacteria bacterium]|nr:hypothetical protein [Campylobacterota bacterium]
MTAVATGATKGATKTHESIIPQNLKDVVRRAFLSRQQWDRSGYVGASEIAYCPLKIYYDKVEPDGFTGNGRTERGHAIEVALIRLLKEGGLDVRYYGHNQKEFKHTDAPLVAHPDGIIYEAFERPHKKDPSKTVTDHKEMGVVEVKSLGSEYFRQIKEPLSSWVVQTRLNAWMAGLPKALLIAVNASDLEDLKWWEFEAMSDEEAKVYVEKAKKIFAAIELGVEPIAEPSQESCKWCAHKGKCHTRWVPSEEAKAKEVEADDATKEAIAKMIEAKELKAKAKELEDEAKAKIIEAAKENEAAKIVGDGAIAIIEHRKGRTTIDTKKLFAEHPEIDRSKYEKKTKDSVVIKIKEIA